MHNKAEPSMSVRTLPSLSIKKKQPKAQPTTPVTPVVPRRGPTRSADTAEAKIEPP